MCRLRWIGPAAGVLVLIAAHFAYWRYLQSQLDAGFAAWTAARVAAGWTVNSQPAEHGGWPLAATLRLPDLALRAGSNIPAGLAWSADRLDLRIDLLSPGTLEIEAQGTQHLRVADLPDIAIAAASTVVQMPVRTDATAQPFSLIAHDLRAATAGSGAAGLAVGLLQVDATANPEAPAGAAALAYRLTAEAVNLPAGYAWALGSRISSLAIEGTVEGPVSQAARGLVPVVTAWRDGGGKLRIVHLALGWGPLGLSGSAAIALDERLQPVGTGEVRMVGYAAALDAMASGHVLTPSAASAAKAVLSLLAQTPEDGGPPEVDVPLTLQDRVLSMRQFPLARMPELIWPER